MKTSVITLGIGIVTAIVFTSCQKEDNELVPESVQYSNSINEADSESAQLMIAEDANYNSVSYLKVGVSGDCKQVDVCQKGKLKTISINAAYTHMKNGDMLFSCDPDEGLELSEVITIVTPRIIADGGNIYDETTRKAEFEEWFEETYCGIGGGIGGGDTGEGGAFQDGGGSDL